eukprot:PhF_6_TR31884/c1_g1_i4/m.47404
MAGIEPNPGPLGGSCVGAASPGEEGPDDPGGQMRCSVTSPPDDEGRSIRLRLIMAGVEQNPGPGTPPVAPASTAGLPTPPAQKPRMKQPLFRSDPAPSSRNPDPPIQPQSSLSKDPDHPLRGDRPPPEPPPREEVRLKDFVIQPHTKHSIPQTIRFDPESDVRCPCIDTAGKPCTYTGSVSAMRYHVNSVHGVYGLSFHSSAARIKSVAQKIVETLPGGDNSSQTNGEEPGRSLASQPPRRTTLPAFPIPSFEEYKDLVSTPSLVKVAHMQREAWRDIVSGIAYQYQQATPEEKTNLLFQFVLLPKRFLYRPVARRSIRAMARDIRARCAGNFDKPGQGGDKPPPDALRRAETLVKEGALGKAARTLDSEYKVQLPPDVQRRLAKELHPTCYLHLGKLPPRPPGTKMYVDLDDTVVTNAVRRLPKAAAPGPSGWTRELLIPTLDIPEVVSLIKDLLLGILNGTPPGQP